jgi:hypothetical protein
MRASSAACEQLPDRAALIAEDYWFDMAIQYLTLTGEQVPPETGSGSGSAPAPCARQPTTNGVCSRLPERPDFWKPRACDSRAPR